MNRTKKLYIGAALAGAFTGTATADPTNSAPHSCRNIPQIPVNVCDTMERNANSMKDAIEKAAAQSKESLERANTLQREYVEKNAARRSLLTKESTEQRSKIDQHKPVRRSREAIVAEYRADEEKKREEMQQYFAPEARVPGIAQM